MAKCKQMEQVSLDMWDPREDQGPREPDKVLRGTLSMVLVGDAAEERAHIAVAVGW